MTETIASSTTNVAEDSLRMLQDITSFLSNEFHVNDDEKDFEEGEDRIKNDAGGGGGGGGGGARVGFGDLKEEGVSYTSSDEGTNEIEETKN
eukprot:12592151-Ditylum_brightwellii.AAC.1